MKRRFCFKFLPLWVMVLLWITVPLFSVSAAISPEEDLMRQVERPGENSFVFNLQYKNFELTDGINTYPEGEKLWIPLSEFFAAVEFPITVDPSKGTAEGSYLTENQKFNLDLSNRTVEVDGQSFDLTPDQIERHEDDIYVESKALESWFGFKIDPDIKSLTLNLQSERPLPALTNSQREDQRKKFQYRRQDNGYQATMYQIDNSWWSVPQTDVYLEQSGRRTHPSDHIESNTNFSIISHAITAGLDTEFSANSSTETEDPVYRLNTGRYDPDGNLLGVFKEFKAGDIYSDSQPLISDGHAGRGAYFSTFDRNRLSETSQVTLRGELPIGWEVEVYRNDLLTDYATNAKDGQYEFVNLETNTGLNVFKLIFYGPQGQRREETQSFYIEPGLSKKNKFSFKILGLQDDKAIIETNENEPQSVGTEEEQNTRLMLETEYGLTDTISVKAGAAQVPNVNDAESTNFATAGLSTSLFRTGLEVNGAIDDQPEPGSGYNVKLRSQLWNWSLSGQYSGFDQLHSERAVFNTKQIKSLAEGDINGNLSLYFLNDIPVGSSIVYAIAEDGTDYTELEGRLSYTFFEKIQMSADIIQTIDYQDAEKTTSNLRLGTGYGIWNVRGEVAYDIRPYEGVTSSSVTSEWNFYDEFRTFLRWQRNYANETVSTTAEDVDIYTGGLSDIYSFGALGFQVEGDTQDNYSASLTYSVGIGYDPSRKKIHWEARKFGQSGSVSARVFLDKDQDGNFTRGDLPISNAKFQGATSRDDIKTDENGFAFVPSLPAYQKTRIGVQPESLQDNVAWVPKTEFTGLMPRPGSTVVMDFPVLETGAIEGTVYLKSKKGLLPAKGLTLILLNPVGGEVTRLVTSYDGYYLLEQIPLGLYTLTFDQEQLKRFGYNIPPDMELDLTAERPEIILKDIVIQKSNT